MKMSKIKLLNDWVKRISYHRTPRSFDTYDTAVFMDELNERIAEDSDDEFLVKLKDHLAWLRNRCDCYAIQRKRK